ncbi:MAG: LacI family transcriptional regulator [Devosia sp.]|uniref:LacI family transcriptional regulator n=1 Tax=Devosia sp. TaxID=1871048 RepID=UPI0026304210|nr:LacI family transcriptional regulator [Devosia sp.]MDB5542611.1 LacI family transcriptional regulator [Devosia sp.]
MTKSKPDAGRNIRQPRGKRATLKTISELTGLSLSTVSLSLRGGASLKEETRQKVEAAARSVGYVPDRAGVRLRTGKTNVIALVLDGSDEAIDFSRHMIRGIGEAIGGTRYHLTVMPEFDRVASVETVRYILENRTADGVIITHTGARDRRVQLMMDHDFPFVSHGRTEFFTPHPFHDFHAEAFTELAVERLVEKGCRDVMLAIGDDTTNNYHNIVRTLERAAARHGVKSRVVVQKAIRPASAEMRQFGRDLADRADRPDGFICDSETRAISMLCGLQDGGVMLERDIHFICKQTSDILSTVFPGVDTIEEDVYAAGVELTRLLLRRIDGEPAETLQTLSEPVAHWRS